MTAAFRVGYRAGYMHKTAAPDMVDTATSTMNAGIRNLGGIPGWANFLREYLGNASGKEPAETLQQMVKDKVTSPSEVNERLGDAMQRTPFGSAVAQNYALAGEASKARVDPSKFPADPAQKFLNTPPSLDNPPPSMSTMLPQYQDSSNKLLQLILERKKQQAPAPTPKR